MIHFPSHLGKIARFSIPAGGGNTPQNGNRLRAGNNFNFINQLVEIRFRDIIANTPGGTKPTRNCEFMAAAHYWGAANVILNIDGTGQNLWQTLVNTETSASSPT
jgi:hypothetical protein